MRLLPVRAGIRYLVVAAPDVGSLGACSIDLLTASTQARSLGASVGFLKAPATWPPALAAVTTDVPRRALTGPVGVWCRVQWRWASTTTRASAWWRARMLSMGRETARELRRYAGDDRYPAGVRTLLKNAARSVGHPVPIAGPARFPRRLIRDRIQASLDREARARAAVEARGAGIPPERPLVAIELPHRVESAWPAVEFLLELGYAVVRIGDPRGGRVDAAGVVDLACGPRPSPLLEFFVLQSARFVVCESRDVQHAAYLTGTPTLVLNARDPISRYPIRTDGAFTLTGAVELDTGRVLSLAERLEATAFQNERNIGHIPNPPDVILDAVREMHEGTSAGWQDTAGQVAFRTAATQAAQTIGATTPAVAEWGADAGFLGDGRVARMQADAFLAGSRRPEAGSPTAEAGGLL
jgi:putative glycosyltransferase (TIGR04372 family)